MSATFKKLGSKIAREYLSNKAIPFIEVFQSFHGVKSSPESVSLSNSTLPRATPGGSGYRRLPLGMGIPHVLIHARVIFGAISLIDRRYVQ